jgi:hypothetical protein
MLNAMPSQPLEQQTVTLLGGQQQTVNFRSAM